MPRSMTCSCSTSPTATTTTAPTPPRSSSKRHLLRPRISVSSQLVTIGLDRLDARLSSLLGRDFTPLMSAWDDILQRDNRAGARAGARAGLDGHGKPLRPVTYRPIQDGTPPDMTPLHDNNLRSSAFRRQTGPPLAPRGGQSRIITNYPHGSRQRRPGAVVRVGGLGRRALVSGKPQRDAAGQPDIYLREHLH